MESVKMELNGKGKKAMDLLMRYTKVMADIKAFVGKAHCDYRDGVDKLKEIASEEVVNAYQEAQESEDK